jgi:heptosyltransferase II
LLSSNFSEAHALSLFLEVPESVSRATLTQYGLAAQESYVCLLPGAARGDSKRWPSERYSQLARMLLAEYDVDKVIVLGSTEERALCEQVAQDARDVRVVVAGNTNLLQLAALLGKANLVVSNDSGGMHLGAALDVPVIAIFGETNPELTGPIGPKSFILQRSEIKSRSIARISVSAIEALKRISVSDVLELVKVKSLLKVRSHAA